MPYHTHPSIHLIRRAGLVLPHFVPTRTFSPASSLARRCWLPPNHREGIAPFSSSKTFPELVEADVQSPSNIAWDSHIIADLTIIPIPPSGGVHLSTYVAEMEKVLRNHSGINTQLHANGTNIEGTWDGVISAAKATIGRMHEMGCVRVLSSLKLDTRTDEKQSLQLRIDHVEQKLAAEPSFEEHALPACGEEKARPSGKKDIRREYLAPVGWYSSPLF